MGVVFYQWSVTDDNAVGLTQETARRLMPLVGLKAPARAGRLHHIEAGELRRRIRAWRRRLGEHEVGRSERPALSAQERRVLFGGLGFEDVMDLMQALEMIARDVDQEFRENPAQLVTYVRRRVVREGRRDERERGRRR